MYSNNIANCQESTTILNACTKKVWKLIECITCHKLHPTRDKSHDLQIALPNILMLLFFFSILPVLHTQDTFTLVLNFEVGHFAHHFLLLSFFWCYFERNSIHTASLSHFISFVRLTTCFLSSQGRLLNSGKHRLFRLHIQHTTHYLFE